MKTSEALEKALGKFHHGLHWTRYYEVKRGVTGKSYCAIGAVRAITLYGQYFDKYGECLKFLQSAIKAEGFNGTYTIQEFNDTYANHYWDIKRVFKRAIECAKAHEALGT